jgi:hypothetical protein
MENYKEFLTLFFSRAQKTAGENPAACILCDSFIQLCVRSTVCISFRFRMGTDRSDKP